MNNMKSIRFPPPVADDMVRAILAGHKTVTRRVVKPQPKAKLAYCCIGYGHGKWSYPVDYAWKHWNDESFRLPDFLTYKDKKRRWTPPCHADDILYVRETRTIWKRDYEYKADVDDGYGPFCSSCKLDICTGNCNSALKWHPSIYMPRKAARIFLRVTGVRVERLQDITDEQVKAEGVESVKVYSTATMEVKYEYPPKRANFKGIWNNTIKPSERALYGWDANPWVWVIKFERISREEVTP